jgi:hypothetical protein
MSDWRGLGSVLLAVKRDAGAGLVLPGDFIVFLGAGYLRFDLGAVGRLRDELELENRTACIKDRLDV